MIFNWKRRLLAAWVVLGATVLPLLLVSSAAGEPLSSEEPREIQELRAFAFPERGPQQPQTNSLLIVKNGKILFEQYANGASVDQPQLLWSVSKSITNAVLGLLVDEQKVDLDASICQYLKSLPDVTCRIRVRDLAQHSSGLNWTENYERAAKPTDSAVLAMLYGEGPEDLSSFITKLHLPHAAPGTEWRYSSGDTNLLVVIMKQVLGKDFDEYVRNRLIKPLGIPSLFFERDAKDVWVGSSYGYSTARDLARYGQLWLNQGRWGSKQILSDNWIRFSLKTAPAMQGTAQKLKPGESPDSYGAQWWLNYANPAQGLGKPWPRQKENVYAAQGHWGQYLLLDPDEQLLVVRLGNDRAKRLDVDELFERARAVAKNQQVWKRSERLAPELKL